MKVLKLLSVVIALLFVLSACEKVAPPYVEKSDHGGGDTSKVLKRVLLEDYTGHTCVNCPDAAKIAHDLKELYGNRLVVIAVHSGYFAEPHPGIFENDYRTEAGNEWTSYFGIQSYPSGIVNRVPSTSGSYVYPKEKWGELVSAEMQQEEADADIKIKNTFSGGALTTEIDVEFLNMLEGTYYLEVCITEDSIVSAQKNENPTIGETPVIYDYVFMHMLRGSVNGTWGENIFGEPVQTGKTYSKSYQYTITGKPEHSHVVAFIYNYETKSVVQVAEAAVMK